MASNPNLTHHPYGIYAGQNDFTTALAATKGPITASTLGAGGSGYVVGDTGTVATGNGDATYVVDTLSGSAVATYTITAPGTGYSVGTGQATAVGGAQPGVGTGFTINVTAIGAADVIESTMPNGLELITGSYFLINDGVDAATLALPNDPMDDGKIIRIVAGTAFAHTVTTPADGINGASTTLTFGGDAGDSVTLEAYAGTWWVLALNGVTVS